MEKLYTLIVQRTDKIRIGKYYGTIGDIFSQFINNGLIDEEAFEFAYDCPLLGYYDEESEYIKGYLDLNDVTEEEMKHIVDEYGRGYYKTWEEADIE